MSSQQPPYQPPEQPPAGGPPSAPPPPPPPMQPMGQPYQQPGAPVPDWAPYYGASFGVAFSRFWRKYADFTGRASRSELWWWVLAWVAIEFVINIIGNATGQMGMAMYRNGAFHPTPGYWFFAALSGLVWLATIVPWLAISWRRLHDANLAGPFFFLSLIPFAGPIILLVLLALPSNAQGARFDRPRSTVAPPAARPRPDPASVTVPVGSARTAGRARPEPSLREGGGPKPHAGRRRSTSHSSSSCGMRTSRKR